MWRKLSEELIEHVRAQLGIYVLVCLAFAAGVTGGSLAARLLDEVSLRELNDYLFGVLDYLAARQPVDEVLIMQRAFLQNGIFILALWLAGNLFFGFTLVLGLLFYRGFTIGFTVAFLVRENALQGILFASAAVLPQNLLYVPASLLAGGCAVIFSLLLLRRRFTGKNFPYGPYFAQYSLLMLLAAALLAAGGAVEAVITPVFMQAIAAVIK
jgi:stage II sporulation protein M